MINAYLNPNSGEQWDIVIEDGQIKTISDQDYIPQKLKQLLLTGFGEVKTNTNYGIPWVQEILGLKNPDLTAVATTILDVIDSNETLSALGVVSSEIRDMDLNKTTRNLTMTVVLKLSDETEVSVEGITI